MRKEYKGRVTVNGKKYDYSATVDKPNEITTLLLKDVTTGKTSISHGHIFKGGIVVDESLVRETAIGTVAILRDIIGPVHAESLDLYGMEERFCDITTEGNKKEE